MLLQAYDGPPRRPEDLGDGSSRLWASATGDEDVQRMFLRSRAYTIEGRPPQKYSANIIGGARARPAWRPSAPNREKPWGAGAP